MRLMEGITKFCEYLRTNSHARSTAACYLEILSKLPQNPPIQNLTPTVLQSFIEKQKGISPSTLNNRKAAVRSFGRWLTENELVSKNPARLIRYERVNQTEAQYLTEEQIDKFRKALRGMGRDELLFTFYIQTGCRLSEVANLNIADVKGKSVVRIIGKGNKARDIFIPENLQKMIASYVGDKDGPLFKSQKGTRLSLSRIEEIFKIISRKANIPVLSVHALRHSFGTLLYERTKDLRLTQELLGHSSPAMTARYAHVGQEDKQRAINQLFQ